MNEYKYKYKTEFDYSKLTDEEASCIKDYMVQKAANILEKIRFEYCQNSNNN